MRAGDVLRRTVTRLRARRLSAEFGRLLGGRAPSPRAGSLVGLEHEYVVRGRADGRAVDFARYIDRLVPSARGLDPSDSNAYWLPWGALLTADGPEAELAEAPTATRPGFAGHLVARAVASRAWLAGRVGPDVRLAEGVSTHLSVALPDAC